MILKTDETEPVKIIGTISHNIINAFLDEMLDYELWPKTDREKVHSVHKNTTCLPLRGFGKMVTFKGEINDTEYRAMHPTVEPIIEKVLSLGYGTDIGMIILARLKPHEEIPEHRDRGKYFKRNRIHVPLITNPDVSFTTFGKPYYMEVGKMYAINNQKTLHGVINNSNEGRIHLIMDIA